MCGVLLSLSLDSSFTGLISIAKNPASSKSISHWKVIKDWPMFTMDRYDINSISDEMMGKTPAIRATEKTRLIISCQYRNVSVWLSQLIVGTSQYARLPRFVCSESKYLANGKIPFCPIRPSY